MPSVAASIVILCHPTTRGAFYRGLLLCCNCVLLSADRSNITASAHATRAFMVSMFDTTYPHKGRLSELQTGTYGPWMKFAVNHMAYPTAPNQRRHGGIALREFPARFPRFLGCIVTGRGEHHHDGTSTTSYAELIDACSECSARFTQEENALRINPDHYSLVGKSRVAIKLPPARLFSGLDASPSPPSFCVVHL